MSDALRKATDSLVESAKEVGFMKGQLMSQDKIYSLSYRLTKLRLAAEDVVNTMGVPLEAPNSDVVWVNRDRLGKLQEAASLAWDTTDADREDEARLDAQHIPEDHGVPGGDK